MPPGGTDGYRRRELTDTGRAGAATSSDRGRVRALVGGSAYVRIGPGLIRTYAPARMAYQGAPASEPG